MANQTIPRYQSGTPGIGGAISDLVKEAAKTFGPKGITHIKPRIDEGEAAAGEPVDDGSHSSDQSSNPGQGAQSSDAWNKY